MPQFVKYFVFVFAIACCVPAAEANDPEWTWKVAGASPTFSTEAQAAAYMRSIPDTYDRNSTLSIEKRLDQITDSSAYFKYESPKVAPEIGEWSYRNASGSSPLFTTEAELINYLETNGVQSSPGCTPKFGTPVTNWAPGPGGIGPGGNTSFEKRDYNFRYYHAANCNEVSYTLTMRRNRPVQCQPGYSGEPAAPGCYSPVTQRIQGTLNSCGAIRGNPVDPLTGTKSEVIVDYRGPNGLTFTRSYGSRALDETNQLGVGWTHNYRMRVVANASGTPNGLVRGNGTQESLRLESSTPVPTYLSVCGTGNVVKKLSPTLLQVFTSDGSIESYNGSGVLQSVRDPHGLVTTLQYDALLNLSAIVGPFGHSLTLAYDGVDRLSEVTLPSGQSIVFGYTGVPGEPAWTANLTSVTYPDSGVVTNHYEDAAFPHNLTGITREDGVRFSTFAYDSLVSVRSWHAHEILGLVADI